MQLCFYVWGMVTLQIRSIAGFPVQFLSSFSSLLCVCACVHDAGLPCTRNGCCTWWALFTTPLLSTARQWSSQKYILGATRKEEEQQQQQKKEIRLKHNACTMPNFRAKNSANSRPASFATTTTCVTAIFSPLHIFWHCDACKWHLSSRIFKAQTRTAHWLALCEHGR